MSKKMKNNIIKLFDTYEKQNEGRKPSSFVTKDLEQLIERHGILGIMTQWKWLLEDLQKRDERLEVLEEYHDKYPYAYDEEYMIENLQIKHENEELKEQLAEKEKHIVLLQKLKAADISEALYTVMNALVNVISQKLDTADILHIVQQYNLDQIDLLEHIKKDAEDILGQALNNSSLNSKYYDKFLDRLDARIDALKGEENV